MLVPLLTYYRLPDASSQFTYALVEKYVYSHSRPTPVSGAQVVTYLPSSFQGKPCLKKVTRKNLHLMGQGISKLHTDWVMVSSSRIQAVAYADQDHLPLKLTGPGIDGHIVMKPGASWSDIHHVEDGSTISSHSRVIRKETVTVPAGKFQCWVIKRVETDLMFRRKIAIQETSWWSPLFHQFVKANLTVTSPSTIHRGETVTVKGTLSLSSFTLPKR
jgi:hypothetical protein